MKKCTIFLIGFLVSVVILFIPEKAYSIYTGEDKIKQAQPDFVPGRLIVKLKPEVDRKVILGEVRGIITTGVAKFDELNATFSVKNQEKLFKEFKETALKIDKFSSVYILEVQEETDLKQMKTEYESLPEVEYAELDYRVELFDVPNDPLFENQWYLNNTGQGYLGVNRIPGYFNDTQIIKYGTEEADIDALEAFERNDETTRPLVGIIDTGVDFDHPDLAGNIWNNPGETPDNGVDDDHNGFVDDFYGWDFAGNDDMEIIEDNDPTDYMGHGTHCAGIVASVRENAVGVSGINTPCNIMAIKMFPLAFSSVAAKSIIYAADMGCDVINMSWGSPYPSKLIEDALDYAVDKGILPIAASGNSGGWHVLYPAVHPQVFTVGASNSRDEVTHFSTYGDHIEVVAPGEDILSLRADSTDMYADGREPFVHIVNDLYYLADGTSMASPCAVGVAAYILAASPGIGNEKVKEIIQESADDMVYPYGGDSLYSPGKDIYSGYGRVNLNSALQLLSGRLAKIDYPYENAIVSGDVAILGTASGDSFQNYVLEYGEGYLPGEWTQIISSDVPVSKDTLGIWESSGLTGLYSLRLTVGDQNQSLAHVIACNESYVAITSPSQHDTISGLVQVYGSTIIHDFSHYTLEYGYGELPSSWDTVVSSTEMVADNVLGNWLLSFLEKGEYTIRLSAETNGEEIYADSIVVMVTSIASLDWTKELSHYASLSPAVGDVDGDGFDEIVIGAGDPQSVLKPGGTEVISYKGESEPGWPKDTDKYMGSSPALGDLDGDGVDDMVICSEQGVHAYLSQSTDWFRPAYTGGNFLSPLVSPLIADLEEDGDPEVLIINNRGVLYAWRNNGESVIPVNSIFAETGIVTRGGETYPCLAVADLDRDGENEVIAGIAGGGGGTPGHFQDSGGVYIWDIQGDPLLEPGDYPEKFSGVFGIAVANIDEDEELEIIVLGADTTYIALCAFKKDGSRPAGYPIILEELMAGSWFVNYPALGDLEADGILEIVISVWSIGEARIYAWHQDGTPLGSVGSGGLLVSMKLPDGERRREVLSSLGDNIGEITAKIRNMSKEELLCLNLTFNQDPVFAQVAETVGSPVLADVDEDGNTDIIARAGYLLGGGYERVFAWDYEGNPVPGFPLYVSDREASHTYFPCIPVMADMDKDGKLNLLLVTSTPGAGTPNDNLISLEFETDYNTTTNLTRCWPQYMHDQWNSGRYGFDPAEEDITISDIVYLINYLFNNGPPPDRIHTGDGNCDRKIDLTDVVFLINYLFKGGPKRRCQ